MDHRLFGSPKNQVSNKAAGVDSAKKMGKNACSLMVVFRRTSPAERMHRKELHNHLAPMFTKA